ncbi:hypothetical protein SBA3_3920035 [Candidatus Sulfopaludibacter sp. SbA3]|nr:hypothetical protein SBA3_3920035 [Candidatus Sulfopaludibacter sp. SbA3]
MGETRRGFAKGKFEPGTEIRQKEANFEPGTDLRRTHGSGFSRERQQISQERRNESRQLLESDRQA